MSDQSLKYRKQLGMLIHQFSHMPLKEAATELFAGLGYASQRTLALGAPSTFARQFDTGAYLRHPKAMLEEWQTVELICQITDDELSKIRFMFKDATVTPSLLESYVFFAIELNGTQYSRSKLAGITRQINRIFQMPVLVLYKYGQQLSLSIINRRRNKRDENKDVLGKVTTIHALDINQPHPGHLDIVWAFSLPALSAGRKEITNFDQLHMAWESVFNIELLNQRFYRELSNWFFWARDRVDFPNDANSESSEHRSTSVIRLLTRLLFCWFLREKRVGEQRLIPDLLFDGTQLPTILQNFTLKGDNYYRAILQNLFFATLNLPMHSTQDDEQRRFAADGDFMTNRSEYGAKTLYRYANEFRHPDQALSYFATIPHLNGGLFTCLDIEDEHDKQKISYLDGFSRNPKKAAKVPNYLFFGEPTVIDLSKEYGDSKRDHESVRGIIHILNDYKFTLTENTPIEQEVALDPELLGQVFENLLAAYNPETKATARNQTGSFYTPRTIVDFMVDQSVIAYFAEKLTNAHPTLDTETTTQRLTSLLAYNDHRVEFNEAETTTLIHAIETCKIFDPACGSGAFPMGVLNKLVYVLQKLDPYNLQWKEAQIRRLDSPGMRDVLKRKFEYNDDDYGRKLGLIENCIFGSDIQPIAIQISKLRFFISLLCDQRVDPNIDNYGIEPLPNLETKFVVADTLIELPEVKQQSFDDVGLTPLRTELAEVRHRYFLAQKRDEKRKLQAKDYAIRQQIATYMQTSFGAKSNTSDIIQMITAWDPYNPQSVAQFFDMQWMFGIPNGTRFDIVIGNPPYVQIQTYPDEQKRIWQTQEYDTYAATADIYCLFYERGLRLLRPNGYLSYITSNRWMRAEYGAQLRTLLSNNHTMLSLDFGMSLNFNAAAALTCVIQVQKNHASHLPTRACYVQNSAEVMQDPVDYIKANGIDIVFSSESWVILSPERQRIKERVSTQGIVIASWDIKINRGVVTGLNDAFYIDQTQYEAFMRADPRSADYLVRILRGRAVDRYAPAWDGSWMISTFPAYTIDESSLPSPILVHLNTFKQQLEPKPKSWNGSWSGRKSGSYRWFETQDSISYYADFAKPKIIYPNMTKFMPFYYDKNDGYFTNQRCFIISGNPQLLPYLTAVFNSALFRCCFKDNFPELLGNTYELSKVFFERIPIKKPTATEAQLCNKLVTLIQYTKQHPDARAYTAVAAFIEEVIDLCVIEFYFADHLSKCDLNIIDFVAGELATYDPDESDEAHDMWAHRFYETCNDPKHPIRTRLLRREVSSPDIVGVILRDGRV